MPRARNIKPSFFANEYLADLPMSARLLFIGLWTLADRDGRLEDRPKGIKGKIFPYDDVDVDEQLRALAENEDRFIQRYEAGGKRYIQICKFAKHQSPHINEPESVIPPPPTTQSGEARDTAGREPNGKMAGMAAGNETGDQPSKTPAKRHSMNSTIQEPCEHHTSTVQAPEPHGTCTNQKPLNPESGILNPEPGLRIPGSDAREGALNAATDEPTEAARKPRKRRIAAAAGNETGDQPSKTPAADRFDSFWNFYPRKTGKIPARKAFDRIPMDDALFRRILEAILKARKTDQWTRENGRFIPNPATWLNQGRWDDEYGEANGNGRIDAGGSAARNGVYTDLRSGREERANALAGFKQPDDID